MSQYQYKTAPQRKKGYFPPETAFCFHHVGLANDEVKNITGRPIFFQNGKYYLSGAGITLPDAHSLLDKKDKSFSLSEEEILQAKKLLKNLVISELHEQIKRTYEVQFVSGNYRGKDAKIYLKNTKGRELSHEGNSLVITLCKTDFEFCPHFQQRMGEDFFKIQRDTKNFYDNLLSDKNEFDVASILFDNAIPATPKKLPEEKPVQATPAEVLTLQERCNDAVSVVFADKNNFKLSFLKLKVAQQDTTLIITNLVDLNFTVENYETNFDEKFAPYLREITKILGFERLEYVFSAPVAPTPQPKIPQADNVAETKKLLEKIQKTTIGGEVKSISNFGFPKKLPEKNRKK